MNSDVNKITWHRAVAAGLVALAVTAAGCAAPDVKPVAEVPIDVSDALLPPVGFGRSPVGATAERFQLNVRDMSAEAFFQSLVDGTSYNMVVQPGVTGKITLNLKNVTVPEVMEYVRDAYDYDFVRTPGGFMVLAETLQTRTFRLNYLNLQRVGRSRTVVSSGQITDRGSGSGANSGAQGQAGGQAATGTIASSGIDTESSPDFWTEVDRTLKMIVPDTSGRKLSITPDAGLIVVRAMTSELLEVGRYLKTLQANLTRQVIIEAKIIEVRLNEKFQAGINWTALGTTRDGYSGVVGQFGGAGVYDTGATNAVGNPITVDPATGAMTLPVAPTAIGGAITAVLNINDFNAVIELLQGQGDVKVLSSPRVSTVNNQKAIIKVGSDEFFVTGVRSDTTTGAATTTNRTVEFTPFFSGIALDVTPQIDEDGIVILHVHPTVSEVRDGRKDVTLGGQTESFPLALSNVREADSIVRARSGQVIVIGGLMQESSSDDRFGVPLLSRLPLIGFLFRQTRVSNRKSELVILLKPQVVETDEQWDELTRAQEQRSRDLEKRQRSWWN